MSSCCSPSSTTARPAIAVSSPPASTTCGVTPSVRAQLAGARQAGGAWLGAGFASAGSVHRRPLVSAHARSQEEEDMIVGSGDET